MSLKPLPVEQWDESLAPILSDMKDRPINVHKLMANHPALLQAWWNFRNYSVAGGDLGQRHSELVILRVAVHMKAWYEWGSHVERSLNCGITLAEIERVRLGGDAPGWSDAEALLLKAVDELIANYGLSIDSRRALEQHFSTRQLLDLMAIHGMYVILACMINTWGLELDDHVQQQLPESISRERFEAELTP
jgi:4-carboxymuconolactone decarboxylase